MTAQTSSAPRPWTCPFCSLLCDGFSVAGDTTLELRGSDCPRSKTGLARHARPGGAVSALVDDTLASVDDAVHTAAERLSRWQQPLFSGLATDVAGARALYRLAARTGAICDHAHGSSLMHSVRAQQDRGQFYTTMAEVRSRADLIVCVGTQGCTNYPELFRRFGLAEQDSPCRAIAFVGVPAAPGLPDSIESMDVAGTGDLFTDLQQLFALVGRQRVRNSDPGLAALAERLHAARYAVLVWEAGALPAHGALLAEALNRIVGTLNRHTRAASFGLGGSDGGYTVNHVFTWLSGLPLRTRAGPQGLEHEPLRFDTRRLLANHGVDGMLWIASFDPEQLPPATDIGRIVLGPPAMQAHLRDAGGLSDCVFIPVATPGLNSAGHLFRTDGGVVVPLVAVRDDGLPNVATVIAQIADALEAAR